MDTFLSSPIFLIFLGFSILFISLQIISFVFYRFIKKGVGYPEQLLVETERILSKSKLVSTNTRIKGKKVAFARQYITITNKRLIIAANNFGFWSYKYLVWDIWYEKKLASKGFEMKSIKLNELNDGIIFHFGFREFEVKLNNANEVFKQIPFKELDN